MFERIPSPVVAVHRSQVTLRDSSFLDAIAAVRVGDAHAEIRGCTITGAREWSLQIVGDSATAMITKNQIRGATMGILNGARVELVDNRIEGTREAAIEVVHASPSVRKNTLTGFDAVGLRIAQGSGGVYEDNVFGGKGKGPAIAVTGGSEPVVRRTRIGGEAGTGIQISGGAHGLYEYNRIDHTRAGGIHCGAGADPVVRHNTVRRAGTIGILVESAARGLFEDNVVEGNAAGEFTVTGGACPILRRNHLTAKGESLALVATEGASVIVEDNTIKSQTVAVVVEQNSAMELRDNQIDARVGGILVHAGGSAVLSENKVRCPGHAVMAMPGSHVVHEKPTSRRG